MKKVLFYVCLIGIVFTFQGCPLIGPGPMQDRYDPVIGCAYIYSPKDSVYVRYYDIAECPYDKTFSPSDYFYQQEWYPEQEADVLHSGEKHELHVRKLTNNGESIVIEGRGIYINDECWYYDSMMDPADSIRVFWNLDSLRYDTVIFHRQYVCPYKVVDVIEQLSLHYPDLVHRLNDTIEHNFNNHLLNTSNHTTYPRIYLPTK